MSEIATRSGMNFPQKISYAQELAMSSMLPKQYQRNPANILFALEYAEALGLPPISAITSIYVVEGKPTASADLIASMVRKAGHKLRVSGDDTYALAEIVRADDPEFTYSARWDIDKARTAGLASKNVWKSYPAAMLRSRAITEVARMGASDALYGVIYTPEEVGAQVDGDGAVIGEVVDRPAPPAAAPRSGRDRLASALGTTQPEPAPGPVVVESERGEPAITKAQLTALNAAMTSELGFTQREDKLAYLSGELGREIISSSEVTKAEASRLIDQIKREADEVAQTTVKPAAEPVSDWEPPAEWQGADEAQGVLA